MNSAGLYLTAVNYQMPATDEPDPFGDVGEPPVIELANIRFLAGYRRPHLVDDALVRYVRAAGIDSTTLAEAMKKAAGMHPRPARRSCI